MVPHLMELEELDPVLLLKTGGARAPGCPLDSLFPAWLTAPWNGPGA